MCKNAMSDQESVKNVQRGPHTSPQISYLADDSLKNIEKYIIITSELRTKHPKKNLKIFYMEKCLQNTESKT